MQRSDWLNQMRTSAEALYDRISPQYWVSFGLHENETHREYLRKFLDRAAPGGRILSAGCGAGRYDGVLLEAGHPVLGIDQSAGMLARARQHFPQALYQKVGFQEMDFRLEFDGVICIDALEHVSPEDYPHILAKFGQALKSAGILYFTVDRSDPAELERAYQGALAQGLPVVLGEVVDRLSLAEAQIRALGPSVPVPADLADPAVYHFYPSLEQVRTWVGDAGLTIDEEGTGSGYHHFLVVKKQS